jgi:hypothetical protein
LDELLQAWSREGIAGACGSDSSPDRTGRQTALLETDFLITFQWNDARRPTAESRLFHPGDIRLSNRPHARSCGQTPKPPETEMDWPVVYAPSFDAK